MDSKITAIEEYWENIAKAWAEFWTHPSIEGGITLSIACLTLIAIIVFIIYKVWAHFKLAKMQLEADIETIKAEKEAKINELEEKLEAAKLTTSERERIERKLKEEAARKEAETNLKLQKAKAEAKAKIAAKIDLLDKLK